MWKNSIWFPKPCQDTAWYILVIPPKKNFEFENKLDIKRSDFENFIFLFLFMDFYYTFKKKEKKWGGGGGVTRLIIFQEGQIQPHPHKFRG